MNGKLTLVLALAAGLAGGALSRCALPSPVFAQTTVPPAAVVLVDRNGHEIRRAGVRLRPAGE